MPNLNAALACAQLEQLNTYIKKKRNLAIRYENFFVKKGIKFKLTSIKGSLKDDAGILAVAR